MNASGSNQGAAYTAYSAAAKATGFNASKLGFSGGLNQSAARGASLVMNAAANDNEASSEPLVSESKTEDGKMDQAEINKKNFNPVYAYFVLFIVLMCRIMVQWHRKGLTYAYGYTGLGAAAGNPIFEIATAYPELK